MDAAFATAHPCSVPVRLNPLVGTTFRSADPIGGRITDSERAATVTHVDQLLASRRLPSRSGGWAACTEDRSGQVVGARGPKVLEDQLVPGPRRSSERIAVGRRQECAELDELVWA